MQSWCCHLDSKLHVLLSMSIILQGLIMPQLARKKWNCVAINRTVSRRYEICSYSCYYIVYVETAKARLKHSALPSADVDSKCSFLHMLKFCVDLVTVCPFIHFSIISVNNKLKTLFKVSLL